VALAGGRCIGRCPVGTTRTLEADLHDIKAIRDNPAAFDQSLANRGLAPLAAGLLAIDDERRALQTRLQDAQARQNAASKDIGKAKAARDEARAQALMADVAHLKAEIQAGEAEERAVVARLDDALAVIPNVPFDEVPVGADETGNVELRRVGTPATFAFAPKEHFELGEALGLMDFEAAAKISGARFVVLKGALARLERALAQFMLDLHTETHGYTEINPPLLVLNHTMFGTAQLPKFTNEQFFAGSVGGREKLFFEATEGFDKTFEERRQTEPVGAREAMRDYLENAPTKEEYWLTPTSEVTMTNLVRESIVDEKTLPLRMTAATPCFRSEAGSAGRDTRGMIRQHQFMKVELVSITTPETSAAEHERMTACAEEVLKRLELPFRTIVLCTGDMGFASRKTYDIEVWLPGQNAYREISSCSNCGDFQARRMNARYRPTEGKGTRFVHTLNGSGVAVGRCLVAILENYQTADGSITIPTALRPYMGGLSVITRP
jgi:seryl-tRNA synthetase